MLQVPVFFAGGASSLTLTELMLMTKDAVDPSCVTAAAVKAVRPSM